MKYVTIIALLATLATAPAAAQDGRDDLRDGTDMMSEAMRLLLQGLMKEIEPALRGLEGALDDLDAYHPPEVLPNGDILIRRKRPSPEADPEREPGPDGQIEL